MANNSSDGLIWFTIFILALFYWLILIIIEYFVFFLILGLIIFFIYYYASNAERWEKERKMKNLFCENNHKNHSNFVYWHELAVDNLKVLRESPLNDFCSDSFNQLRGHLSRLNRYSSPPNRFFNKNRSVNHNPYLEAYNEVKNIIEKTTEIPLLIENLNDKYSKLRSKDVLSKKLEPFERILNGLVADSNGIGPLLFKVTDDCRIYHYNSENDLSLKYVVDGAIAD